MITKGSQAGVTVAPFSVSAKEHVFREWNIYIHGNIEDVADFENALNVLGLAEEADAVILWLNSGGGNVQATDTLVDAIMTCKAKVIVRGSGLIASAATTILLAGDEFYLHPSTVLMFHTYSYGAYGNTNQTKAQVDFFDKHLRNKMYQENIGLFSEQEIEEMHQGREFWMDAEEFLSRFEQREAYLEKQMKDAEKEARKQAAAIKRQLKQTN